ncbi:calcium-binding protein [Bradyrhizobium sp. Ce-3]|uniref:calcium-binding protein n=1 Tax=Bradyrhizobium sp. Ce-3 TaxID=2913970 RepID=UPI001FC84E03|nr:calcium-binding protein [Bradyrhizobium sp. Ce-3]GKQ53009.1 hypothetical protein BRSPCE3_38640 [Bradyrhizobium sp. Ce-3]
MTTYVGTLGNDVYNADYSATDDVVYGLDGDDTLYGTQATMEGGDGNDEIVNAGISYGGNGNDFLHMTASNVLPIQAGYGGAGDDVLSADSYVAPTLLLSADGGNDTIYADNQQNGSYFGGTGDDYIYANPTNGGGSNQTLIISGDAGDDRIFGGLTSSLAVLQGGEGNDLIMASGASAIYGGLGNDALYGSARADTIVGDQGVDLLEGNAGDDYLYMPSGGGTAYGGDGNDVAVGSSVYDVLIGDAGDDTAYGYGGNDYLYGGAGNDVMFGGDGIDVLLGDAGNDYFDGGAGVNYYFGGGGNNTFVSNDVPSVQVVQDFNAATDVVQLDGSGFTSFADVLSHSYQNGAYFVVQVDGDTAVWLNGATAGTVTAANFSIVS